MAEPTTIRDLIDGLARRGERPAIIALTGDERREWSYAELHRAATGLAAGLAAAGVGRGEPVGLFAPNRPEWVVACLAAVAAGAVVMPVSDQAAREELARAMADSGCRRVFTTRGHLKSLAALEQAAELEVVLLDDGDGGDEDEGLRTRGWRDLRADTGAGGAGDLPAVAPGDPAALLYTSGTTGAPKGVLLNHGNIAGNIASLVQNRLAGPDDRVLTPLPLHHIYPLTVGLLAPLAVGAAVVMPAGVTGPQVVRALRETRATIMIGVPRLYAGLMEGIEGRIGGRGRVARRAFHGLLDLSLWLRRRTGRRGFGRVAFAPLRRQLGPGLRLLASGGARLDPELAWRLEALGYEVLTGYGLTETSPILTFNPPGRARLESAGLPLPGVELRIEPVEGAPEAGQGEILARGPNVFGGYRDNPEATAAAFADGWFRTGDLGLVDPDGYLHVTGRTKEVIVLAGGKNIYPEDAEGAYGESPLVREVAVLEHGGRLAALIVPEEAALRERGGGRPEKAFREEIGRIAGRLPGHLRVGDFALTRQPLPRTQIGKLKRHELPPIYEQEKSGRGRPEPEPARTAEDDALLASRPAGAVFAWLKERYPGRPLTLDSSPQFDLDLDSFAWMSLTMELQERFGVGLSDDQLAEVMTLRDLLRAVNESAGRSAEEAELSPEQERWLRPPGPAVTALGAALFALNRAVMRGPFRLRVEGLGHLPAEGAFVLTPNHASYLDPLALAAALPRRRLQGLYWAGWTGLLFKGPISRAFSRATGVVPVDPDRGLASTLAYGRAVLERGRALVWFPEGRRSPDGRLHRFLPGVGLLLDRTGAPAVPVWIGGTYEALPPDRRWPRLARLTVVVGRPVTAAELVGEAGGEGKEARIAEALRETVAALGAGVTGDGGGAPRRGTVS